MDGTHRSNMHASDNSATPTSIIAFKRHPCKARGVSGDHNLRTAYFDIPVNAQHGMLLVCSHPKCAESGRCFRYCAVCDVPVAKRNFPMRHTHGLTKKAGELSSAIAVANVNGLSGVKRQRTVSFANDVFLDAAPALQASTAMTGAPTTLQLMNITAAAASYAGETSEGGKMKMHLNPTEFKWLALLHNRPSMENMEDMNQWMDTVLKVSEQAGAPSSSSSSFKGSSVTDAYYEASPEEPVQEPFTTPCTFAQGESFFNN